MTNVSVWVNDAMRLKAEHDRGLKELAEVIADFETEYGEITEAEMEKAAEAPEREQSASEEQGRRSASELATVASPQAGSLETVLDAGAFIAFERGDRMVAAWLKRELLAGRRPRTHGGVVGQIWRAGARQARTARLLQAIEVISLGLELGRRAGLLLGRRDGPTSSTPRWYCSRATATRSSLQTPRTLPLAEGAGLHAEIIEV